MGEDTLLALRRVAVAGLLLAACQAPPRPAHEAASQPRTPPTEAAIGQAAVAAVVAAPWDRDPAGWGTLCSPAAPCDTVVVEPRIVALPAQAPAFFVPEARDLVALLTTYTLTLSQVPGRHTRLGSWRECSGRRDHPAWGKQRVACVAVGLAGPETASPEAMTFALLVATPARGLSWPRVRVTRPKESWRGRLISNASE
jgi:hypothetical protein